MSPLFLFRAATATPKAKSGFKRSVASKVWAALLGVAALTLVGTSAEAASFAGLGGLQSGSIGSEAWNVSADGSAVVGNNLSTNSFEAFRWTADEGMVGLGNLPGGNSESFARGISADGSIVVGHSNSNNGDEAFRWTADEGIVGLGDLPGGSFESFARGGNCSEAATKCN